MLRRILEWTAFLAGVAVAALAMVLIPVPAHADKLDQLDQLSATEYCRQKTMLFADGLEQRNLGKTRVIKQATPDMMERYEHKQAVEPPDEAIYVEFWDSLSERDQQFARAVIFDGWDAADHVIQLTTKKLQEDPSNAGYALNVMIMPGNLDQMKQAYFEDCARRRAEKQSFHKTASSQMLDQQHVVQVQCERVLSTARWVWSMKAKGLSEDAFWQNFPLPENYSEGAKEAARKLVWEAYRWPRGELDFLKYIYDECVAGR